jgi:predicted transcriptional regulator/ribosome-associated translation inhibitor RaiA
MGFLKVIRTLNELAETTVSELNISKGNVLSPDENASKVLGILKDTNKIEAVAANGEKYGIITVRDLLGVDQPANTKIETIWKQVGKINSNTSVLEAVDLMFRNNVTAIPLVEKDYVSLISQQDITSAMINIPELSTIQAKDIMISQVVTVEKETSIAHARRIMLDKGFSHIPIINGDKVVGIITGDEIVSTFVTDITKTTTGDRSGEKVTRFPGQVGGFMNSQPLKVNPDTGVLEVVRRINKMGEKYCLVVDNEEKLHGIITHRELLEIIHSLQPEPELPVYIVGIDEENFFETAVVEDKIRRTVERSMKIMEEITEVSVRVKSQRNKGERTRYKVTARALGPSISFNVENEDWGLMEAFDGLVDALDKKLRRSKKEPQKGSRRGRRRPNPHLKP